MLTATALAGFFGSVSFVSIIANLRYENLVRKLKKENTKLEEELICQKLIPLHPQKNNKRIHGSLL